MFGKKCFLCRRKIAAGAVSKDVEIFGRVGTWKRDFCCEHHLAAYEQRTEALMKTRRTCVSCAFR